MKKLLCMLAVIVFTVTGCGGGGGSSSSDNEDNSQLAGTPIEMIGKWLLSTVQGSDVSNQNIELNVADGTYSLDSEDCLETGTFTVDGSTFNGTVAFVQGQCDAVVGEAFTYTFGIDSNGMTIIEDGVVSLWVDPSIFDDGGSGSQDDPDPEETTIDDFLGKWAGNATVAIGQENYPGIIDITFVENFGKLVGTYSRMDDGQLRTDTLQGAVSDGTYDFAMSTNSNHPDCRNFGPSGSAYLSEDKMTMYMVASGDFCNPTTGTLVAELQKVVSTPSVFLDNSTLNGNYVTAGFEQEGSINTYLLNISANGNGSILASVIDSSNNEQGGNDTYSVSQDGALVVNGSQKFGAVSVDGQYIVATETFPFEEELNFGVKKSSGKSVASLNGEYLWMQFAQDYAYPPVEMETNLALLNFNGNGQVQFAGLRSSQGQLDNGTFNYFVNSDGTIGFDTAHIDGVVSDDESVIVATSNTTRDQIKSIMVCIKKSSGWTNAKLSGTYTGVVLWGTGSSDVWTSLEDFTFDGNGTLSYTTLANSKGEDVGQAGSVSYNVSPDGTITLAGDTTGIVGAVSADGNMFAILVIDDANDDGQLIVGVKKP